MKLKIGHAAEVLQASCPPTLDPLVDERRSRELSELRGRPAERPSVVVGEIFSFRQVVDHRARFGKGDALLWAWSWSFPNQFDPSHVECG